MKLTRKDFDWAASAGLISTEQASSLWRALEERTRDRVAFDLVHILYAFGAILVVAAMTWFMSEAWERFGGGAICLTAAAYAVGFVLVARRFRRQAGLSVPGGILYALAVFMTPVAIYGLQQHAGIWVSGDLQFTEWYHLEPKNCRLIMEVGTMLAGLIALRLTRFPLLLAPVIIAAWVMAMDVTMLVLGSADLTDVEQKWVSAWFGLAVLIVSYLVDRRTEADYAFWGYLLGLAAFWGGLSAMESDSELCRFVYCLLNLGLMVLSVLFARRVFMLFGAVGVFIYLGDLAGRIFKDSLLFPVVLVAFGMAIIYLGTRYQRNREAVEGAVRGLLPGPLRRLLPTERLPA